MDGTHVSLTLEAFETLMARIEILEREVARLQAENASLRAENERLKLELAAARKIPAIPPSRHHPTSSSLRPEKTGSVVSAGNPGTRRTSVNPLLPNSLTKRKFSTRRPCVVPAAEN